MHSTCMTDHNQTLGGARFLLMVAASMAVRCMQRGLVLDICNLDLGTDTLLGLLCNSNICMCRLWCHAQPAWQ
jgi:hypothetical protein